MRRARAAATWPTVAFQGDFLARVGRAVVRLAGARERREGAGMGRLLGVGAEVVGWRPYRPGEDLRMFDWSLWARHKRPFLRVAAREASEHWCVLLDVSGSMAVGPPGKLQRAAEVAAAVGAVGVRAGASVRLLTSAGVEGPLLRRAAELARWLAFLEEQRAAGSQGLSALDPRAARLGEAGRVVLVGDLLDLEPRALERFARRGRELACLQVLAPHELQPAGAGARAVEWVDPESGRRLAVELDRPRLESYERRLRRRLEAWRHAAETRRALFACRSSAEPFEVLLGDAFGG